MRLTACVFVFIVVCSSCNSTTEHHEELRNPSEKSLEAALHFTYENGFDSIAVGYRLNGIQFQVERKAEQFLYTKTYSDSAGNHRSSWTNDGFSSYLNGKEILPREANLFENPYFMEWSFGILPLFTSNKDLVVCCIQEEKIDGKRYERIQTTQKANDGSGGEVCLFWVDAIDGSIDYMAYQAGTKDRRIRFRKGYNPRRVNGVYFQDFISYSGPSDVDSLKLIGQLYRENRLDTIAIEVIENLSVSYFKP